MAMQCNVGGTDKALRIGVGIALAAAALFADIGTTWKIVAGVVAAIALMTAIAGYCPLNSLLGINSCKKLD